jgi:hypothetical protein
LDLRKRRLKTKKLLIALLSFLMVSGIAMTTVSAVWTPSLPAGTVTLQITNQTPWTFPWMVALSGVGAGFDVSDGTYTGWCVDTEHSIDRTQTYDVNLFSSYSPPSEVASVDWNRINYVLNNKDAGTADDIQAVLWYIVGGTWITDAAWGYSHTTEADAILADAMANGGSYEPDEGDILAVICLPVGSEEERAQMLVIELMVPPLESGYTPGFWKHNIGVCLGYSPGHFSAFNDGTKLTCELLQGYATTVGVSLEDAYAALNSKGNKNGEAAIRADMANAFNAAAGYGPFVD